MSMTIVEMNIRTIKESKNLEADPKKLIIDWIIA